MKWQEAVAVGLVIVGLLAGGYIAAQRPAFWIEFGTRIGQIAWPYIVDYVTRRNSPEVEKAMQLCLRRGGEWDNFRKTCRT